MTGVPLLMLSSADRPGDPVRSRALGIARCLTKPVKQSDLFDAIITALAAAPQKPPESKVLRLAVNTGTKETARARVLRILLAEDNAVNQKLAVRMLEKHGHKVVVANNGKEALAALQAASFDVVLMDVQMPEMGGLEATAQIRIAEQGTGRHIPVIAMTAHAMKGDRERCLEAGMDGYVSKPVQPKELLAAIEEWTQGPAESLSANALAGAPG
jgi:CheY-like chemotaxis protein